MKTLNVTFTCAEFAALEEAKDKSGKNWHDFLLGVLDYHPFETVESEKTVKE